MRYSRQFARSIRSKRPFVQWVLYAFCFSVTLQLHAQKVQNAQGIVPAIRYPEKDMQDEGKPRKNFFNRHLIDFSDSINFVAVDPVIQSHIGQIKGHGSKLVWDNIRGARFRARIDGIWHIGGELLERQGIASPMLSFWAAQRRIPGWGRSKIGRNNESNTLDNAYYDVARARGWMGWSNGDWSVDTGIDALHIGAGKNSAFLSIQAAPSPYLRLARDIGNHRSSIWLTHWMSTERGPEGETAESLLNRSRVLFALHSWQLRPRLLLQTVYSFVREKEASQARGAWNGWEEGEQYFAHRHWGGLEVQVSSPSPAKAPWTLYVQSAFDFESREGQTSTSSKPTNTLTHLAGLKLKVRSFFVQIEYFNRKLAQCNDCFGLYSPDGIFETTGPNRALLQNAGISIHSLWDEGHFATLRWSPTDRLYLQIHNEANPKFSWITSEVVQQIQLKWPLSAFASITTGKAHHLPENPHFSFWQIGLRSGIPSF